jgi:hypothetical protein
MSGAVIAKIVVLVFIIFFIQRRPQGLFAVKGRAVEGMMRLYGPKGWLVLGFLSLVVFVLFPILSLVVSPESPFHLSQYWVTLIGKIMCYAIVAIAMDLIWAIPASCRSAMACSSRSAAMRWACT